MRLKVKKLYDDAKIPTRGSESAAGMDLYTTTDALVRNEPTIIPTGIAIEIPEGHVGIIKDRSGLAAKKGIHVLAGVIDSDYRGELGVVLVAHADHSQMINKGDRIAQLLVIPCPYTDIIEVQELETTARSANGFGSTGN